MASASRNGVFPVPSNRRAAAAVAAEGIDVKALGFKRPGQASGTAAAMGRRGIARWQRGFNSSRVCGMRLTCARNLHGSCQSVHGASRARALLLCG